MHALLEDARAEPTTRLLKVGRYDSDADDGIYAVEIELGRGVRLSFTYGSVEGLHEGWYDLDADHLLDDVERALLACMSMVDRISETMHDLRVPARRIIAGWEREGLQVRRLDLHVRPFDYWRGSVLPMFEISLEATDLGPECCRTRLSLETTDMLEAEMDDFCAEQRLLTDLRRNNLDKGACGVIDKIALNALETRGYLAEGLQRFASENLFWLSDDTALLFHHGEVGISCGNSEDAKVMFHRNGVVFKSIYMSTARLQKAVGRPVTELFSHPYLSDDMTVLSAVSEYGKGTLPSVELTFSMPRWLVCSTSRRWWKKLSDEVSDIVAPPRNKSTVIPFRRPAA